MDENPRLSLIFVIAQVGPALRSSLRLAPMLSTSPHLRQHFLAFKSLGPVIRMLNLQTRSGHLTGSLLEVTASRLSGGGQS